MSKQEEKNPKKLSEVYYFPNEKVSLSSFDSKSCYLYIYLPIDH